MTKTTSKPKTGRGASETAPKIAGTSKLETLLTLLRQPGGATVQELAKATAWQTHSVRVALAGTLKKKGHAISSELVDGVRRYRVAEAQA